MACNFAVPLPKLNPTGNVETGKNSDTMSEVSESGTVTSGWASRWDSREDLRELLSKLGLSDVSELYQERFKVDRCKLERMLTGGNDALLPADVFFAKVMEDTDTIITWPNKLKIGGKSRKDPHVRIAGTMEDVQAAKDRILTILSTRCNRVTMKMDVSYTDHSHIIGKGGASIKRVMEETKCHVHFPDSNRSNLNEKSNQVSVSGDIEAVEVARCRVRELIPLIFGFELPITSKNFDVNSTYVVKIQEQYKVQVIFKTRPRLHATLVLIKGVEWEVQRVKHATILLMEYMCENLANQISVQMSMEISPNYHPIVLGKNHSNLKAIIQNTNCQIMFPDAQDPNIPTLKKSNVVITGNINSVYKARQLLLGSLPLIIIFDLPDDMTDLRVRPEQITEIQTSCDVTINIRQKANKTTKACVIKGIERDASNIYKARNLVLGIDDPPIHADIPLSYHLSASSPVQGNELLTPANNLAALSSPLISPSWFFPSPTNPNQQCSPFVDISSQQYFFPSNMDLNAIHHHSGAGNYSNEQQQREKSGNFSSCSGSSMSTISSPRNNAVSPNNYGTYGNLGGNPGNYNSGYNNPTSEVPNAMLDPGKSPLSPGNPSAYEYDNKRLAAFRAMRAKPIPGNLRVPHNSWSGYGVSHTSPGGFLVEKHRTDDDIWKPSGSNPKQSENSMMNTSNLLDQTSTHVWNRLNKNNYWEDLETLLTAMNLEHYVSLFKQHEIDLSIFSTMTDQDLIDIGVTAFGARRRIFLAISELNKKNASFSAAPGAERLRNNMMTNSPGNAENPAREQKW